MALPEQGAEIILQPPDPDARKVRSKVQSSKPLKLRTFNPRPANLSTLCDFPTGAYSRCATLPARECPRTDRQPLYAFAPQHSMSATYSAASLYEPRTYLSRGVQDVDTSLMRLAGTEVVESKKCLHQDVNLHPLKQDHPSCEGRPTCSPCLRNKVSFLCIFLVDIKLALGNNPHLFTVFPLEPSCRLRHAPSIFC